MLSDRGESWSNIHNLGQIGQILGLDLDEMIRDELEHPATPPERLESVVEEAYDDLSNECLESWVVAVARNPNCGKQLLALMSELPSASVRSAVAGNVTASKKILARLAADPDASVRLAVVENVVTPPSIRQEAFGRGLPMDYIKSRADLARMLNIFDHDGAAG